MKIGALMVALVLIAVGGCSTQAERSPQPTVAFDDAVPSARAAVEELAGVESEKLTFYQGSPNGDAITGSVEIAPEADAVEVLDDVYRTLWGFEGYEPTRIRVVAERGGDEVATAEDLGSSTTTINKPSLRERYGPWPGAGSTARA